MRVFTGFYKEQHAMDARYAYDVNITLHLLQLNTLGVCSFITLSVLIQKTELNQLSLPLVTQAESFILSEESASSHSFNVLARLWLTTD